MPELIDIRDFVQQVSEAIAAVVDVDITVFDQNLRRIAGTGLYRSEIGQKITPTIGFSMVLRKGQPIYISNPLTDEACRLCLRRKTCNEVSNIAFPIIVSGKVKGVMALLAFNKDQRLKLIGQKENYSRFLSRMAELISSKILEQQAQTQLRQASQRLESIINALTDGVLMTDASGLIVCCNPAATKITGIKNLIGKRIEEIYPRHPMLQTLRGGRPLTDKEVVWRNKRQTIHYLCSTKPLYHEDILIGVIAFLKDFEDVSHIVNEVGGNSNYFNIDHILGNHPLLIQAKEKALKAAGADATVLIQGESGTGKELFARAVHGLSHRKKGPFIAINCAAIPETLLESELFGYEGGAFTGANNKGKPGKFELAKGGTVFLDEIGDLPLILQAKLLRVLEEGEVSRLGGIHPISLDVRVIAATNQKLEELVANKEFRGDLFYRLNVIPLRLPPLRERPSDISLLAKHFLETFAAARYEDGKRIDPQVFRVLESYGWPGNVRELRNAMEYAVHMADGVLLQLEHIPERIRYNSAKLVDFPTDADGLIALDDVEKMLLERALKHYGYSDKAKGEIAARLGISRASVYRKVKKYSLDQSNAVKKNEPIC